MQVSTGLLRCQYQIRVGMFHIVCVMSPARRRRFLYGGVRMRRGERRTQECRYATGCTLCALGSFDNGRCQCDTMG